MCWISTWLIEDMKTSDVRIDNVKGSAIPRRCTALIALCLFFVLLYLVITGQASGFDDPIREFFYGLRSDALNTPIIIFTNLSHWLVMVIMCIILLIVPASRRHFGVPLSAGALATVGINQIIKHLVQRPRPDAIQLVEETSYSFPSGHSINSMFFYGMAIWLVWHYLPSSKLRSVLIIVLAIPMMLIGPSRVYLGVHYPTDVIAGWCLGFVTIVIIIEIILYIEDRQRSRA